jgi:predicted acyltransferase
MVIGNYIAGILWIPSWLKHAPDIGFTIADLVAPAFVFVIGLNYGASFQRRFAEDSSMAYRHFANRYLALIGIGAIISAVSVLVGSDSSWGVLQSLGVAGLLCLLLIRFSTWLRLLAGLGMLIGYQYLLDTAMLENVLGSSHGGPFGSVSWAALLVLSTAVADFWRKGQRTYAITCSALVFAASIVMFFVPVSKNRVSLSFILLTLAISALVFFVFQLGSERIPNRAGMFSWWGQKALSMYLIHLLLLSVFVLPEASWWYSEVPPWLLTIQLLGLLTLMTLAARWLTMRNKGG